MKKNRFLLLFLFSLLLLLVFPKEGANRLRLLTARTATLFCRQKIKEPAYDSSGLALENHLLKLEVERLKQWLFEDEVLKGEIQELKGYGDDPFSERRKEYLHQILHKQLASLPAQVIFREPAAWNSRVWVNIGERENKLLGKKIVAKDSPVVVGKALVGIVETVLETKSQVRLITDPTLHLSVRAVRRGGQNHLLREQACRLIQSLSLREDLNGSQEVAELLGMFLGQFATDAPELYLAKGRSTALVPPPARPGATL
jgi:cell shape-determining protein MreC